MKTQLQLRIYFCDDIYRIINNIESIRLGKHQGREVVGDDFFEFTSILKRFITDDTTRHYTYEDIKTYIETMASMDKRFDSASDAYRAIAKVFGVYEK